MSRWKKRVKEGYFQRFLDVVADVAGNEILQEVAGILPGGKLAAKGVAGAARGGAGLAKGAVAGVGAVMSLKGGDVKRALDKSEAAAGSRKDVRAGIKKKTK